MFDKPFFKNTPWDVAGHFHVGRVAPAIHYTMGGLRIDDSLRVLKKVGGDARPHM